MRIRLALLWALTVLLSGAGKEDAVSIDATAPKPEATLIATVYFKDLYCDAEVPMSTGEPSVFLRPEEVEGFLVKRLDPKAELFGTILIEICPVRSRHPDPPPPPRTLEQREKECYTRWYTCPAKGS